MERKKFLAHKKYSNIVDPSILSWTWNLISYICDHLRSYINQSQQNLLYIIKGKKEFGRRKCTLIKSNQATCVKGDIPKMLPIQKLKIKHYEGFQSPIDTRGPIQRREQKLQNYHVKWQRLIKIKVTLLKKFIMCSLYQHHKGSTSLKY